MNTLETIREKYHQMQASNGSSALTPVEQRAFDAFNTMGIPSVKHEEWKYTRISGAFNKDYTLKTEQGFSTGDLDAVRLPGYEAANELVFVNGLYSSTLSIVRSKELFVQHLEEAVKGEHKELILEHLGHSNQYIKDGIYALNTAFVAEGVFIYVKKGSITEHPVYIYNITDARSANILSQPRSLIYVGGNSQVQVVETYSTIGLAESFTNQVMEFVVEQDAVVDFYKIQNDAVHTTQVSTTHFRQIGKSVVNAVTISLNGGIV
ncbi:MAG: SufD family Fe-S cluster assembly protein, partial [Chitinophagaceae bacterium]